jgi:integrase
VKKSNRKPIADLAKGVGVSRIRYKGVPYWRVRLGKRFTGGEIRVKHFSELDAARDWIFGDKEPGLSHKGTQAGVVNVKASLGSSAFALTTKQLAEAENAFSRLPDGTSLTTVVNDWMKRRAPHGGVKTVREVAAEFIISRRGMGVRDRTLVQYESYLRIIEAEFADVAIANMERAEIEDWIAESEWSPRTRKNYLVTLSTLFNFAMDREYCPTNLAARIERPIMDDKEPGILTIQQVKAILKVALNGVPERKIESMPSMVAPLAIALFAGLRRSELCALDWSEVTLEQGFIEVKGAKAKTRQRRLVTISTNLKEWLKLRVEREGPVTPSRNADVFGEKLRGLASVAGLSGWPHNAMRHSFATYFLAHNKDENLTASQMGNSPSVVHQHYKALVKDKDAQEYWKVSPRNLGE